MDSLFDDEAPVSDDKYLSTMQGKSKALPNEFIDLNQYDYNLWVDDKIKISDKMLINRDYLDLK